MTDKEVIKIAQGLISDFKAESDTVVEFCNAIINTFEQKQKAAVWHEGLDQGSVVDKIRAEIQELRNCSCSNSDGIIDDVEDILDKHKAENLIEIPENATIGDVIKAVFPDWKIEHIKKMSGLDRYDINIDNFNRFSFYEDFWNSPYQPVKECNRISAETHEDVGEEKDR